MMVLMKARSTRRSVGQNRHLTTGGRKYPVALRVHYDVSMEKRVDSDTRSPWTSARDFADIRPEWQPVSGCGWTPQSSCECLLRVLISGLVEYICSSKLPSQTGAILIPYPSPCVPADVNRQVSGRDCGSQVHRQSYDPHWFYKY